MGSIYLKMVCLGPSKAGKSALLAKLANEQTAFQAEYKPTIGADLVSFANYNDLEFCLWDLSGSLLTANQSQRYYQTAKIALLPLDLSLSYGEIEPYLEELNQNIASLPPEMKLILVATKEDIQQGISLQRFKLWCQQHQDVRVRRAKYLMTSAQTRETEKGLNDLRAVLIAEYKQILSEEQNNAAAKATLVLFAEKAQQLNRQALGLFNPKERRQFQQALQELMADKTNITEILRDLPRFQARSAVLLKGKSDGVMIVLSIAIVAVLLSFTFYLTPLGLSFFASQLAGTLFAELLKSLILHTSLVTLAASTVVAATTITFSCHMGFYKPQLELELEAFAEELQSASLS